MSIRIKLKDQTCFGDLFFSGTVDLSQGSISVKELIEIRVSLLLEELNRQANEGGGVGNGAPQNFGHLSILSGKLEDIHTRKREAIDQFSEGTILLFIGDQQKTELDDIIQLSSSTEIVFVRLIPIVGG